jgi:diguanylate cyclase (GGDEF)-like protein/PAS domain S-box-containing protein
VALAAARRAQRSTEDALRVAHAQLAAIFDHAPVTMSLRGLDGRYMRVNEFVARSFGARAEELVGRHPSGHHDPATAARIQADDAEMVRSREPIVQEFQVALPDGRMTDHHVVRYPVLDERGEVIAFGAFGLDITERKQAERARERAHAELQVALGALEEAQRIARIGSWTWDPTTKAVTWSAEMYRLFGRDPELGPTAGEGFAAYIHPEDRHHFDDPDAPIGRSSMDFRIVAGDGVHKIVHGQGRRDPHRLGAFVGTLQDVTALRHAEAELRAARDYADAILAAMGEGYALVIDGEMQAVNDTLCRLTGFSREQLVGSRPPMPFWPPEEIERSESRRERLLQAGGGTFEVTMMREDGTRFPAEITSLPARNADGSLLGWVNTVRDITERYEHDREQQALREISELVAAHADAGSVFDAVAVHAQALLDAHSGMVTRFDEPNGVGVLVSSHTGTGESLPRVEYALDGVTASAEVFRTGRPARYETTPQSSSDPAADVIVARQITGAIAAPVTVNGKQWGTIAAAFSGQPIPPHGEHRLARFADLVAMAIANTDAWDALARQASTDSLTGLANRRAFTDRLRAEVNRAQRYDRELSIALLDLDHFKAVNDRHGHQTGDHVLVELANRLRDCARADDLIARIGGEEFSWLMPETGMHDARNAAERMRRIVQDQPFSEAGRLTVSAGVAALVRGQDAETLIRHADRALYAAKDQGRNTTVLHTATTPGT